MTTPSVPEVARLQSERATVMARAERILDRAALANRDLLASEARLFDREMTEVRRIDDILDDLPRAIHRQATDHTINESRRAAGIPLDFGIAGDRGQRGVDLLSVLERGEAVDIPLGEMLAGKRTSTDGRLERRDLFTSTTGSPVPVQTSQTIYEYLVSGSGVLRSNVNILNTVNGASFRLPKFTAYSSAAQVAEGTAIASSDPTLATVTFGAYKYATLATWSRELQDDTDVDLSAYISRNLATALSETFGPKLVTGSGSNEPQGITNSITTGVTSGTGVAGAPTANNVLDLFFSLPPQYREGACWIMKDSTLAAIAKLTDSQGRYLLTPSLSADVPSTILGRPVYTDPTMPATGTTNKSIFFGDMSRFFTVRFAGPLRLEIDASAKFENDEVVMRAVQRIDSRIVDTNAARCFIGAAS